MTIRQTLVLLKLNMIPQYLIQGWIDRKYKDVRYPPHNLAQQVIKGRCWNAGISLSVSVLIAFLIKWSSAIRVTHTETGLNMEFSPMVLIPIALIIGGCVVSVLNYRGASEFGRDLEKLKEALRYMNHWVGWSYHFGQNNLSNAVETTLVKMAGKVLIAEITHDINSDYAKEYRRTFAQAHAACLKFNLADEKYNKYFSLATASEDVERAKAQAATLVGTNMICD